MIEFQDRIQAGERLASAIQAKVNTLEGTVVAGIPKGGVVVAATVAKVLETPFNCLVIAKVPMPARPEVVIGALDPDGEATPNLHMEMTRHEVLKAGHSLMASLEQRVEHCRAGRTPVSYEGKNVIVVDEVVSTGLTATAAAAYVRRQGAAALMLATPVIDREALYRLEDVYDAVVRIRDVSPIHHLKDHYQDWEEPSDEYVSKVMDEALG
jgi:putative phosphoribosyl transferase